MTGVWACFLLYCNSAHKLLHNEDFPPFFFKKIEKQQAKCFEQESEYKYIV